MNTSDEKTRSTKFSQEVFLILWNEVEDFFTEKGRQQAINMNKIESICEKISSLMSKNV